jgi:hypothetical protein
MTTPVSAPKIEAETDVKVKAPVKVEMNTTKSKNSLIAINGTLAEDILCKSPDVLEKLGNQYFKKNIVTCEKLKKKKSDHRLTFDTPFLTDRNQFFYCFVFHGYMYIYYVYTYPFYIP